MKLNRTVVLTLDASTDYKKQKLDEFLTEYVRVVNQFIDMYWPMEKRPPFTTAEYYKQVDTWLLPASRVCAGKQALDLIRAAMEKDKNKVWRKYKSLYHRCAKTGRNHFGILDKSFKDWIKDKRLKLRVGKPVYTKKIAEMSASIFHYNDSRKATSFDGWMHLSCVFPDHYTPDFPVKKHKQFFKYLNAGYKLANSARLKQAADGKFYLELIFKKEVDDPKPKEQIKKSKVIGIDTGLNRLFAISDGRVIGERLKELIVKLDRKKQGSNRWKRAIAEIRNYIGYSVNQIGIDKYDAIVMEDLQLLKLANRHGANSRWLRKRIGHWNVDLLYSRITNRCEENRVLFALVDPAYTSQRCSKCGAIHKESRRGPNYKCVECGYQDDADLNASKNILNRFLGREPVRPCDTGSHNDSKQHEEILL